MQEMQETLVRSLGQEDPLEKRMATYSSILAWRIPWTEEPGRLQSMGLRSQTRLSQPTLPHFVSRKDPVFPSPWVLISAVDMGSYLPALQPPALASPLIPLSWPLTFFPARSFLHFLLLSSGTVI